MDALEAAKRLAETLRNERLVTLVGSGASADSRDSSGRTYRGLPTAQAFVRMATKRRPYIDPDWNFVKACDEIFERESRAVLEELLITGYRRPGDFHIPPAHKILAWLPFAAYITSNYDQFLERQLKHEDRRPSVVIENEDLARIRRVSVPVIKYHGCISKPETIVATTQDHKRLHTELKLVRQLIAINLAQSNLLVIGHGLGDGDLEQLLRDLLADLQDYLPTIYVVREPERVGSPFTLPFRHELRLRGSHAVP